MTAIPYPDQDAAAALQEQVVTRLYDLAQRGVISDGRRDDWLTRFDTEFDRNPDWPMCRVAVAERWLHRIERLERSEA